MTKPWILVAEDERITALNLRQKLTRFGYDVSVVASGDAVLRAIESRPDLILMDIKLAGSLDGIETAARIPPEYHIPVVYLTAHSDDVTLNRAAVTNSYGYLLKPFVERELRAAIHMTLARNRAEVALRAAQDRLDRVKMEAFADLAGGMAQKFSALLNVMFDGLEELADCTTTRPELAGLVRKVSLAAVRGEKLVQQLLAFSQPKSLSFETVSLDTFISSMEKGLFEAAGDLTEIRSFLPQTIWKVRVDVDELENALLNLATNAREAMPNGGSLTIRGTNVTLDQQQAVALASLTGGRYVLLSLTDSGTGMPEDVARCAFQPFFTTKSAQNGTGLGLSQVFGFVTQSGGHIGIHSHLGGGTTIEIHLPAVQDETSAIEVPVPIDLGDM
jgi:signal transduction histidine kinase